MATAYDFFKTNSGLASGTLDDHEFAYWKKNSGLPAGTISDHMVTALRTKYGAGSLDDLLTKYFKQTPSGGVNSDIAAFYAAGVDPFGAAFSADPKLTAASAAFTNSKTALAKVAIVGDSILEGEGASTAANRSSAKVIAAIRAKAGAAGAAPGMIGCYHGTQLTDSASWRNPLSANENITSNAWFSTQAWRGADMSTVGGYAQWTVTCDSFDVVHLQGTGDGGSLSVSVDGGAATVIDTSSGAFAVSVVTHINIGGAPASHTIKVTLGAGAAALDGIVPYSGDFTAGVQWWDASHFGYDTPTFDTTDGRNSIKAMNNFGPHLIIDNLTGCADYSHASITPAQMVTALNTRIGFYKAFTHVPSLLFVGTYQIGSQLTTANALGYTMQQYYDAAKAAIATAGGVWLDLNVVYPTFQGQSGWLASDNGHPSNTGHQKIADAIMAVLAP